MEKRIYWEYKYNGTTYYEDKVTFTKDMLVDFIGKFWYDLFFDENDKLKYILDFIIATAREFGKTYVVVAIIIYIMINNEDSNFVLTRKYTTAAGSFYEMFNQVLGDFQHKYSVVFEYKYVEVTEYKNGKSKEKIIHEIKNLKGKGKGCLFSYGKTGDDKIAIFYNSNYDLTQNQIIFLRGADDADGSRGLSINRGYIWANILEEYSQEVDKGKLEPEEQITRYKSLFKSANRYATKYSNLEGYPNDLKVAQLALANIWDPTHGFNEALLSVIPEKEWREFVEKDIANNTYMVREYNGCVYVRATSLANTFLYPEGSVQRQSLIGKMEELVLSEDDYAKAEILGYTFPGFLKDDNPLGGAVELMMECEEMTREELKEAGFSIEEVQFGTDPGLRDSIVSIPCAYIKNDFTGEDGLYIDEMFFIENKIRKKNKLKRIKNPTMKKMLLKFWNKRVKTYEWANDFIQVNLDMRALSLRDDLEEEVFPKNEIPGVCSRFASQDSQGYGLEQRPSILENTLPNMIFHPASKSKLICELKTLEKFAENKKQPHPRKGGMDFYDALMYAIVKLRYYIS